MNPKMEKSDACDDMKYRSNTINTWLTKHVPDKPSRSKDIQERTAKNKHSHNIHKKNLDIGYNSSKVQDNCDNKNDASLSKKDRSKTKDASANSTLARDAQKNRRKKLNSKSLLNNAKVSKDKSIDEIVRNSTPQECSNSSNIEISDKENKAKKKFKRIITSPLSFKTVINKKLHEKTVSPQSNTISMWLNKSIGSSSTPKTVKNDKFDPQNSKLDHKKERLRSDHSPRVPETSNYLKSINEGISVVNSKTNQVEQNVNVTPKKQVQNSDVRRSPGNLKSSKPDSVTTSGRKLFDIDIFSQKSSTNRWIGKDTVKSLTCSTPASKPVDTNEKSHKVGSIPKKSINKVSKRKRKSEKNKAEQTLDAYIDKICSEAIKRKQGEKESNESSELPSFSKREKTKKNQPNDSFRKYGVTVPSVEEILKEQKDLVNYKNQIASFADIDDKNFELPFSVKDLKNKKVINENVLGCKHLSYNEVEEAFYKNLNYISDIFSGKKYSERHERFFERNVKDYTFTVKDLCYNTSTIVFSFDQNEHMLTLLKKELDPKDKWTLYFFQVLLPELCLKIFMDTHNMKRAEAVKYLDTRPIMDD